MKNAFAAILLLFSSVDLTFADEAAFAAKTKVLSEISATH